jgi:hypothetical protein
MNSYSLAEKLQLLETLTIDYNYVEFHHEYTLKTVKIPIEPRLIFDPAEIESTCGQMIINYRKLPVPVAHDNGSDLIVIVGKVLVHILRKIGVIKLPMYVKQDSKVTADYYYPEYYFSPDDYKLDRAKKLGDLGYGAKVIEMIQHPVLSNGKVATLNEKINLISLGIEYGLMLPLERVDETIIVNNKTYYPDWVNAKQVSFESLLKYLANLQMWLLKRHDLTLQQTNTAIGSYLRDTMYITSAYQSVDYAVLIFNYYGLNI